MSVRKRCCPIRSDSQAQWKNDGCPENIFEIPPLEKSAAQPAVDAWEKRMAPPASYPFKLGSRSLSRLWLRGYTNIEQLKGWKRLVANIRSFSMLTIPEMRHSPPYIRRSRLLRRTRKMTRP